MNSNKQIKMGVVLGYANYAVKMISQFVYVPIMLKMLGQSEYGVYQLVASLISYLSLLNFGFGGAYLRFYSQCKGDRKKEAQLNGTYMIIFCVFAVIAAIVGGILTLNSDLILGDKLTNQELDLAKILLGLLAVNMVITFPTSVFTSIIVSQEKFIFVKTIELAKTVCNPFLAITLLMMGYGSVSMVLVTMFLTIVGAIVSVYYVIKKLKTPFSFRSFNIKLVKEVGVFSFFLFINSIIDQINWNVDNYILGRVSGAIAISIYSIGAQINNIYIQITDMIASTLAPRVNKIVAENERVSERLNELFVKVGRLQSFIVLLVLSGFTIFGQKFIYYWAGAEYSKAYWIALILIVPASIPLCQSLGVDIQRAMNKHKYRSYIYAGLAILNVIISIPLAIKFEAIGSALGTGFSLIVGNGIIMNIVYHKVIGLNIINFWKNIIKVVPSVILPVGLFVVLNYYFPINSVIMLIVEMILYVMLYGICLFFIGMNKFEKEQVLKVLKLLKKS